jgi:hypothetical protein
MVKRTFLKNLEKWLKEAKEFKEKGDMLQSCEKLYSVVESIIKVLAEKENVEAYKEAISAGGWNTYLLGKASAELKRIYSQKFGEDFGNLFLFLWNGAYYMKDLCDICRSCNSTTEFEDCYETITEILPVVARKTGIKLKFESNTEK